MATYVARAAAGLDPAAVILFGSAARGDSHDESDADVEVVLREPRTGNPVQLTQVAGRFADGIVEVHAHGRDDWLRMVREANSFALSVMWDGIALAGDAAYLDVIEGAFVTAVRRYAVERTAYGFRFDPAPVRSARLDADGRE